MDSYVVAAGILLIAVPILFNVLFSLLATKFEYPDILRKPAGEVLQKYREGGTSLTMLWLGFAYSALLFVPLAVLFGQTLGDFDLSTLTIIIGVLAGTVQFVGLIRWSFLVPELARRYDKLDSKDPQRKTIELIFMTANRYLGMSIGEHTGYLLTGLWSILTSIMILQTNLLPSFLGWIGLVAGLAIALGSLEFVGKHEKDGWHLIDKLVPIAYVIWSLWLVGCGIFVLINA